MTQAWDQAVIAEVSLATLHAQKPWIPADLVHFELSSAMFWVSVDKKNAILRLGFGYPVLENEVINTIFLPFPEVPSCDNATSLMPYCALAQVVNLTTVALSTVTTTKFPIVKTQPPSLVASGDNTLDILAANSAVVAETLPPEAQELAAVVAGPNVVLDPSDAAAIDWCIKNPGNKIYDRLLSKRGEFDPSLTNMVYLRVSIGPDLGDSPGTPNVMEIVPPGCFRSVHL